MNKHFKDRIRIVIILIVASCASIINIEAQDAMSSLFKAKNLFYENKYDEAITMLNAIESICKKSPNDTIQVLFNETKGSILLLQGHYSDCIPYLMDVPALYEKIGIRDVNYLESFLGIGFAYQKMKEYSTAEKYYRKAILKSVLVNVSSDFRSNCYLNLGDMYKEQGDSILAVECYKRIDSKSYGSLIDASAPGDDFIDESELTAINMRKEGKFEEALDIYNSLIIKTKERIGTHNEQYVGLLYSKAIVLGYNLGYIDEAILVCEEAISLKDYMPANDEDIIGIYGKLLQYLAYNGNVEKLNEILAEALSYIETSPQKLGEIALFYRLIGNGAYWNQKYDIAIDYYEKYLTTNIREEGLSYLEIPNMLSVAYIHSGFSDKAIILLKRLLKNESDALDENQGIKVTVLHNYGRALMLSGDKKTALKFLHLSEELHEKLTGEQNPRTVEYIKLCED
jgi:tetratricopeptide (TPR) repeat protein